MITSFLKVFLKNVLRHRLFSFINIAGLAIGLACCLVIALFVRHELSYEDHFSNAQRLHLIEQVMPVQGSGGSFGNGFSSMLLAEVLVREVAEIQDAARYVPFGDPVQVEGGNVSATEREFRYADADFLRLFNFTWLAGNPATALSTPDEIVLTRALAEKYFHSIDVVGRTLTLNNQDEVRVSGVVDIDTHPSVIEFSALLPLERFVSERRAQGMEFDSWFMHFNQTFVLLDAGVRRDSLQAELDAVADQHIPPADNGGKAQLRALGLTDIYLKRSFQSGSNGLSNLQRVQIFISIGLAILLIAIVNFMNLSTSRASTRALETGLRLALGSGRGQLIRLFLGEAIAMSALAMMLALVLAELLLPQVNAFLNMELGFGDIAPATLLTALVLGTVLVGVAAGSWPAFYLSRAQPARILRGELSRGKAGQWLRESLVVCQFTVSIALIVVALVMFSQLRFLRALDPGFNPNQVALINLPPQENFNINAQWDSLEQRLLQVEGVEALVHALDSPMLNMRMTTRVRLPERNEPASLTVMPAAADYLPFYGIALLAGRYFDPQSRADLSPMRETQEGSAQGSFILNQSAARALGWSPQEALDKDFSVNMGGWRHATVIGVVEDTISSAQSEAVAMLYYVPDEIDYFFINGRINMRVNAAALAGFNERLRRAWQEYFPGLPLNLVFLDEVLAGQYVQEQSQMRIFGYAAILAVLIACIGLLGLASFNAERRTKEIGVRKVVGGSVWNIVWLLTNDFSRLVLAANLLAWPLAWYAMDRWLQNFVYRIDLTPLVFIGSGLIALCIAWVTVGGTAAKAASRKPVLALRYE